MAFTTRLENKLENSAGLSKKRKNDIIFVT
jgi:hypothetical protein